MTQKHDQRLNGADARRIAVRRLLRRKDGRYNYDVQVRGMVARCFMADGDDFLELFLAGWESRLNRLSFRSKLFVNLRMAIECYLKCLVMVLAESGEKPEDAYKTARKASHSLLNLLTEVQRRSKSKKNYVRTTSNALLGRVDNMKVSLRYGVDVFGAYSKEPPNEQFFDSGPTSATLGSDAWMTTLAKHAAYIGRKAHRAYRQRLEKNCSYLLGDADARTARIKLFLSEVALG